MVMLYTIYRPTTSSFLILNFITFDTPARDHYTVNAGLN